MRRLRDQGGPTSPSEDSIDRARDRVVELKRELRGDAELFPGDELSARYLLQNKIGHGGFATVWKALDLRSNRIVAIKILHGQYRQDKGRRARFFRGARTMVALKHPHIVRVLEPERVDRVQLWQGIPGPPQYCFVMEYMAGGDFRRAVKEGRLEPAERLRVILAIGEALTFAHTHELKAIHRDVKPQNILLGTEGEIRLTDFDLVRVAESKGGTRTGALGTFIYAAPEELEAANKVDARSDVFSLGMTALFAIKGDDLSMTDFRNAEHTIETLEASDAIKEMLARAVSWEAEERYETMAEFCEELRVAALQKKDGTGPREEDRTGAIGSAADAASVDGALSGHPQKGMSPAEAPRRREEEKKELRTPRVLRSRLVILGIVTLTALVLGWWVFSDGKYNERTVASAPSPTAPPSPVTHVGPVGSKAEPEPMPTAMPTPPLIAWIDIPGGTFRMGSKNGDDDEKPVRKVTVSSFRMSRTEVTVAQYRACVDAGVCTDQSLTIYSSCNWGKKDRDDHPINCVDWNQARTFASWKGARLPTEAEWEYAARATGRAPGKERTYPWGEASPSCDYAVMDPTGNEKGCGKNRSWPVCSKPRGNTPEGLCDMAGNVFEWVGDCYQSTYDGALVDGSAREECTFSGGSTRVYRAGSWNWDASGLRGAFRFWNRPGPDDRRSHLGFRLAFSTPSLDH